MTQSADTSLAGDVGGRAPVVYRVLNPAMR